MKLQTKVAVNYSLAAGIVATAVVSVVAVVHATTNYFVLVNLAAFAIVIGGVAASCLVMLPLSEIGQLFVKLVRYIRFNPQDGGTLAATMVQASVVYSRNKSFSQLGSVNNPRIFEALELIEAGFKKDEIKNILEIKKESTLNRGFSEAGLLLTLAKLAPGYGLVGTLVGLIVLLYDMGAGNLDKIGPAMAISLAATLYGVVLANMIFMPLAEFMTYRSEGVSRLDDLILYGVGAILDGRHPVQIRETMRAYLSKPEQAEFDELMDIAFSEQQRADDGQPVRDEANVA